MKKKLIRLVQESSNETLMNNIDLLNNLKLLDKKLRDNEIIGELDVFGGAVMCLGLNARQSTYDIDAIFEPKFDMRELIREVADENNLSEDWINDGVKGFISPEGKFERFGEDIFTNLRIFMATPQYLFAMKCLSCRLSNENSTELNDIKFLVDYLELKSVEEAEEVILQYYPEDRYKPKTHFMLVELFNEKDKESK